MPDPEKKEVDYTDYFNNEYDLDNDPEGYFMNAGDYRYKLPTIGNSIIDSESTAVGSKDYELYDAVLQRQEAVKKYRQLVEKRDRTATFRKETRDEPSEWLRRKEENRAEAQGTGKERGSDWRDEFFNTDAVQNSYKMYNDADPFVSSWMQDDETQRRMRNQALYPDYAKVVAANKEGQKRLRELPLFSRELTNQNDIGYFDIWNNNINQGWSLGQGLIPHTATLFNDEDHWGSYNFYHHQAVVDRYQGGKAHGTIAHEGTHATGMGLDGWQGINETAIKNNWPDAKNPYLEESQKIKNHLDYLGEDGLYPRIMDIRRSLNLFPGEKVTKEMLENRVIRYPVKDLRYFKSDKQILEMLNTLADSGKESGGEYDEEYNEIPRAGFGGRLPQHRYDGDIKATEKRPIKEKLPYWSGNLPIDSDFGSEVESTYAPTPSNMDLDLITANLNKQLELEKILSSPAIQSQIPQDLNPIPEALPQYNLLPEEESGLLEDAYFTATRFFSALKAGSFSADQIKQEFNPLDISYQYLTPMAIATLPEDIYYTGKALKPLLSDSYNTLSHQLPWNIDDPIKPKESSGWDLISAGLGMSQLGNFYRQFGKYRGKAAEHFKGGKNIFKEVSGNNSRPIGEIWPITKKEIQQNKDMQSKALGKASDFINDWNYPTKGSFYDRPVQTDYIRPEVMDRMRKIIENEEGISHKETGLFPMMDKGGLNNFNPYTHRTHSENPINKLTPLIVNPRSRPLKENPLVPENSKKVIEDNRGRLLGVNTADASITLGNQGPYSFNYRNLIETILHEGGGHSAQKIGSRMSFPDSHISGTQMVGPDGKYPDMNLNSWGKYTTRWNDDFGYFTPNLDTKIGREFAEALVSPKETSVMDKIMGRSHSHETWKSSPNELHAELMPARWNLAKKLSKEEYGIDYDELTWQQKESLIQRLQNPTDAMIDFMLTEGNLNKHFKLKTSPETKRKLIRLLPAFIGGTAVVGAAAGAEEQTPQYKYGGQISHYNFKYGGALTPNKEEKIDLKLPKKEPSLFEKYMWLQNQRREGNLMGGAGFNTPKGGAGFYGMAPMSNNKEWKGTAGIEGTFPINEQLRLRLALENEIAKTFNPLFNIRFNYNFGN
jgi:hypothetical protein